MGDEAYFREIEAEWEACQQEAASIARHPPLRPRTSTDAVLTVGGPWDPRSDRELVALLDYYKEQDAAAVAHINRLREYRDNLAGRFRRRPPLTREERKRLTMNAQEVIRQIVEAEKGERYFARQVTRFREQLRERGHTVYAGNRLDRAVTYDDEQDDVGIPASAQDTRMIGEILEDFVEDDEDDGDDTGIVNAGAGLNGPKLQTAGARQRTPPLTVREIRQFLDEKQKDLDIANYEVKNLREFLREYRTNRRENKQFWRQATRRGINAQPYVDTDRFLARKIRDTQVLIKRNLAKARDAKAAIRRAKRGLAILRRRQGSKAQVPATASVTERKSGHLRKDTHGDADDEWIALVDAGLSLRERWRRWREKREERKHRKRGKKETKKAKKLEKQRKRRESKRRSLEQEIQKKKRQVQRLERKKRQL